MLDIDVSVTVFGNVMSSGSSDLDGAETSVKSAQNHKDVTGVDYKDP